MTGMRFGQLTVLRRALDIPTEWFCRCDCSNGLFVPERDLRQKRASSCQSCENSMRAFDSADGRIMAYTNCILVAERQDLTFQPDANDHDTATLLWQVAVGECPAGILADRLEERYDLVELANLLRKGSGVGGG